MPREITTHHVNGCNANIQLIAIDDPGSGGANHEYKISGFRDADHPYGIPSELTILFQNGPIKEVGTNGVTHEVLLAILIDRLEGFQRGPFKNQDNEKALQHLRVAINALKSRTEKRIARGVEGTHTV